MSFPTHPLLKRFAFDLYQAYELGWKHGANNKNRDKTYAEHPKEALKHEYLKGYDNGRMRYVDDMKRQAVLTGFTPKGLG